LIALDTNVLVRMLVEDDKRQARIIEETIDRAEKESIPILILSEVLVETVWVLESVYQCSREEIVKFLQTLIVTPVFSFVDPQVVRKAIHEYEKGGDFADLLIVNQAMEQQAKTLLSFDKKLQKKFPGYVVGKLSPHNLKKRP
jgi:predicted nucleic-acid-binding protein